MNQLVTRVAVHNPMFEVYHSFSHTKDEFLKLFNNHLTAVGYYSGNTTDGKTVIINPSQCALIEIEEKEVET